MVPKSQAGPGRRNHPSSNARPWANAQSWRRQDHPPVLQHHAKPAPNAAPHTPTGPSFANSFAVLAGLEEDDEQPESSICRTTTSHSVGPSATATSTASVSVSTSAVPSSTPPSPPLDIDTVRAESPTSKVLHPHELVPGRIIYVLNPHREKSWRGHPGFILDVAGRTAHVITLTSWHGKTCVQKWCDAIDPARFRAWFLLVESLDAAATHDELPVMRLEGDKKLARMSYVDCKRTHWLDIEELEKIRVVGGDTEYFVTQESIFALKAHLEHLKTVEPPWAPGKDMEEEKGKGRRVEG